VIAAPRRAIVLRALAEELYSDHVFFQQSVLVGIVAGAITEEERAAASSSNDSSRSSKQSQLGD